MKNFGVGQRRIHENEIRLSEDGKTVGKTYSTSSMVDVDRKAGTARGSLWQSWDLLRAPIWTEATDTDMHTKSFTKPSYQNTRMVLWGVRAYAGVTGTYDLKVREDENMLSSFYKSRRTK